MSRIIATNKGIPTVYRRFWECMTKPNGEDGCWEWTNARHQAGYGLVAVRGKLWGAHRLAWTLTNGPIPDGLLVRHLCNNPPCCNPKHLAIGTVKDNSADMKVAGRGLRGRKYDAARLARCPRGDGHARAKLSAADVLAIRTRAASGEKKADLAREFGITPQQVGHIVYRRLWRHL